MAFSFRKFLSGINLVPKAVSTVDSNGDLDVTTDGVLHFHNGTISSPVVTDDSTGNLTNKTYSSGAADVAQSGVFRMGNGEAVAWRNNADSADLSLIATSSDSLEFNGNTLLTATGALVANRAVITDGSAALTSSPTSAAELANVVGLTSPAVGTTQAQVLTNKTLTDNTTFIQDNADNTKKLQFDVAAVTTGTTRTLSVPNANTTLVGTDTSQTLTNKDVRYSNSTKTVADNNTTIIFSDNVILLDASGGSFNLILSSALSVAGKILYFKKIDSSNNVVSIFADSGFPDTIDGQSSITLTSLNEQLSIHSNGILNTWSVLSKIKPTTNQIFTSGSGTYNSPVGVLYLKVRMVGAGGGGAGAANATNAGGGGGGSGAYIEKLIVNPNSTYSYSVGVAGTAGNSAGTGGSGGGATTFSTLNCNGGNVGQGSAGGNPGFGGNGGTATGGDINIHGGSGGFAAAYSTNGIGGQGGASFFGGGGQAGSNTQLTPQAGIAPGSGGGGGGANGGAQAGADGAPGIIIVEEHYH